MTKFKTIIFDLGGVLIDWNPHYVFNDTYFESEEKRKYFFEKVCTGEWNEEQDAGRSIVTATWDLIKEHPEWEQPIRDFYGRWTEMLKAPIPGTVQIFRELKDSGRYSIYALTNWQSGLFDIALVRYDFLNWFDGRVVSGDEKSRKPFPEFYKRLLDRYNVKPEDAVFIDDNLRNVKAAQDLGIHSIHFTTPEQLREELNKLEVL
ncbi:MAG: HAD family phosphatase [Chitinophagaceae bacterium]|nr:MAG: HAD family phosphatase [Chitinophagaceae bacterium]